MTGQWKGLTMTRSAKTTSCAGPRSRGVRGDIILCLILLTLVAAGKQVYSQTIPAAPTSPATPASVPTAPGFASQTTPANTADFGVGGVSGSSFKFGEYNGLQNSGPFGIGNFNLRGGAAYDSTSTWRWQMRGRDLGLETRSLYAEFGRQGKFRFYAAYSELRANRSDTFQTPYLGAGTNNFTLPSNWLFPAVPQRGATALNFRVFDPVAGSGSFYSTAGVLTPPTAAQLAAGAAIRAADLPAFHGVYLFTKRTKAEGGVRIDVSAKLDIPLSYSYEHKSGLKALGAVSSQVSENSVILPIPIDFDTSEANAAVFYRFKQLLVSAAFYGSYFTDNFSSYTYQDVANPTKSATLATAPSNQFNQFTFTAAEKFKHNMKLVVSGSYGRNTQNDAFLGPSTAQNGQLAFGLPVPSLNGLVVSSMVNSKFTAKPGKRWSLIASYKYANRDNQTPVNTYYFQDANESKSGTSAFAGLYGNPAGLGSNTNIYANRPYSEKTNLAEGEAEYALAKRQWVAATYKWEKLDRSCPGSWIDCSDARTTAENTIGANWHKTSVGRFTGRADYAYSWRRGNYNEDAFLALVPMANQIPTGGATQSLYSYLTKAGLTGFGPIAGLPTTPLTGDAAIYTPLNNAVPNALYGSRNAINELVGLRRYTVADRDRNKVYADLDWQATDKLSLHGNGEMTADDFIHSTYGVRKDLFWEASMDASYAPNETVVVDLYYTYDDRHVQTRGDAYGTNSTTAFVGQSADKIVAGGCYATVAAKNAVAKIDPCLTYAKTDRDKYDTLGFTASKNGLLSGNLQLAVQVLYNRGRTFTVVSGGSYVNNPLALAAPAPPLPAGTPAVFFIAAQNYPTVRDDEITVSPTAAYVFKKRTTLKAFYLFQKMMSSDWAYLGMQYGTGTNYLPSNEQAPNYAVSAGGLSLVYTF
jgi:MtrB/PioB family decaheme-associated outer membrane protein